MDFLHALADMFGASRYAAHSICLSSDPVVINIYRLTNLTIAFSYFVIGGILIANRASVVRFLRWIFFDPVLLTLFGMFIICCAITHVTETLTLDYGVYFLDLFARCLTAGVSFATAMRTAWAFAFEHKALPTIVEALEIPEAPPYESSALPPTKRAS